MRKTTLLFIGIVLVLFSCGKKEVKQPSPESRITEEAFALVETIRTAFMKKDLDTLQRSSTADGYRDIAANRKPFESVSLTFTPRWVEIEKEKLTVNVSWKSTWAAAGKTISDRGMAVFVLEGRPLKVSKVLRANPFIYTEQ